MPFSAGVLTEIRIGGNDRIGTAWIDVLDFANNGLAMPEQTINILADLSVVSTKLLELCRCSLVSNMFVLLTQFIADPVQVVANSPADLIERMSQLRCVDTFNVGFSPHVRIALGFFYFRLQSNQDRASVMIRMIPGVESQIVPNQHLVAKTNSLILNVRLDLTPLSNLIVDVVESVVQQLVSRK